MIFIRGLTWDPVCHVGIMIDVCMEFYIFTDELKLLGTLTFSQRFEPESRLSNFMVVQMVKNTIFLMKIDCLRIYFQNCFTDLL